MPRAAGEGSVGILKGTLVEHMLLRGEEAWTYKVAADEAGVGRVCCGTLRWCAYGWEERAGVRGSRESGDRASHTASMRGCESHISSRYRKASAREWDWV